MYYNNCERRKGLEKFPSPFASQKQLSRNVLLQHFNELEGNSPFILTIENKAVSCACC